MHATFPQLPLLCRLWNMKDLAPVQSVTVGAAAAPGGSGAAAAAAAGVVWPTDCAYLEGQRRLLVASMDRSVRGGRRVPISCASYWRLGYVGFEQKRKMEVSVLGWSSSFLHIGDELIPQMPVCLPHGYATARQRSTAACTGLYRHYE